MQCSESQTCSIPGHRRRPLAPLLAAVLLAGTAHGQPTITQQPTNQIVVPGDMASFSVVVSGTGLFTYQWQFNGTNLPNSIITTVAGSGVSSSGSYSGDGGPATKARLNNPTGVAVDSMGNLFIGDTGNDRVRKVDLQGIITTVAGTNAAGFSGDGGLAANAELFEPSGVALDNMDHLFIADNYNHRIRKVGFGGYPTLTLNGATTNNAGNYQVIVSNSSGSITSSVVSLTVVFPPAVSGMANESTGGLTLNLVTTPNVSSRLYAATNLTAPVVWQPIYTNLDGGAWQFTDSNTGGIQSKYYRLSTP